MKKKSNLAATAVLTAVLLLILMTGPVLSNTGADTKPPVETTESEELEGFGDEGVDEDIFNAVDTDIPEPEDIPGHNGPFQINGNLRLISEIGYNKSDEKLSVLQPVLFVEAQYKINPAVKLKISGQAFYDLSYDIEAKGRFTETRQDDKPHDIELKDAYIDAQLSDIFSIRAGRQIIAWGDSDYARITDVINPRDLTAPGLIDLEDARLPVASLRLTAVRNNWNIDAVTVHEHPGSRLSGENGDFDYFKVFRSPALAIHDKETPDESLEDIGLALRLRYGFNGGDISFVAAHLYDDRSYLKYDGLQNSIMQFTPHYDRLTTLGLSGSLVKGSALFKMETAFILDKQLMRNDILNQILSGTPASAVETTSSEEQAAALLGVEYTGFNDLRLSFEAQAVHTINRPGYSTAEEMEYITYFQANKDLLNETLSLDLFWVYTNPGHGHILRLSGTYDFTDAFSLQAGVAFYDAADASADLHAYRDMDRVFFRLKYSF